MKVDLNEATVWIRELLYMNKTELIQTANLKNPPPDSDRRRLKKSEILLYLFERKFNSNVKDPSESKAFATPVKFGSHS